MIFNPLEEFEQRLQGQHLDYTTQRLEALTQQAGVNVAENQKTVTEYIKWDQNTATLKKKLGWRKFWRVLMCITIVLIPVVIWKLNPIIKQLRQELEESQAKQAQLLELAWRQMKPLNDLFTDWMALELIENTVPDLDFVPNLTYAQELDMRTNYDFREEICDSESTLDLLPGHYNGNPFLFERKRVRSIVDHTYTGYKTIYWTETYRDSNGKLQTRTRSQTLQASVVKPMPVYGTKLVLHYCAQGGPELCFSRDAGQLHLKNDRQLERYVRRGERRLQRKTDKALKESGSFMSMSNSDFEVLFDALDRTNEVQFRTLFTPLAQTNMVDLIRSKTTFGDDFAFIKRNRTNRIEAAHSQTRPLLLAAATYRSYDYAQIRQRFIGGNTEYFKSMYFDFAPLWAIPLYQERPVHSLKPIPDNTQRYSRLETEALANTLDPAYTTHPRTKTEAILNAVYCRSGDGADEIRVTGHSYDIEPRVTYVAVLGGDGRFHDVPVEWKEYLPQQATNRFYVSAAANGALSYRSGLYISK